MERENLALGRLDGLARLLPDLQLFLYFYVRKEAVLSSQIEGNQSVSGLEPCTTNPPCKPLFIRVIAWISQSLNALETYKF
jgi:hypothetical protein